VLVATCHTRFGASGSNLSSRYQEQTREGGKAQSGQYMTSWAGLLLLVSEPTSLVVRLCRRVLGRQIQIWARVTMNKPVMAVKPKANNI